MILQVAPIVLPAAELLAQLEQPAWYLPALSAMSQHRQREWLTVRTLLKQMLGREVQILYTEAGKPYLADGSYHISISHTKGYAAVALDENRPVAVDIEHRSPRVERVRSRFMSGEEEGNLSKVQPLIHLLLHWSAKESLFKYLNESDIDFQTQLHIHPFEPVADGVWGTFDAHETRTALQQAFTIRYVVEEAYVLTAVTA